MTHSLLLWLVACGGSGPDSYAVTGTVIEVRDDSLIVAHDDIPGFMDAMTMPFPLANPQDRQRVSEGDTIRGTLLVGRRTVLTDLVVTARSQAPKQATPRPNAAQAIKVGELFPATPIALADGSTLTLGPDQAGPVALTFLYTRCPLPEYCPLVTQRLLSLQGSLPTGARLVAVTLDPTYDSLAVLKAYGVERGAETGRLDFGRVPGEMLVSLAERAGLTTHGKGLAITHDLMLLIIDADGRVIARYGDMAWDRAEVLGHLGG
ncbi:MAG: copper-binding protein [Myxococcota bacterium]